MSTEIRGNEGREMFCLGSFSIMLQSSLSSVFWSLKNVISVEHMKSHELFFLRSKLKSNLMAIAKTSHACVGLDYF